MDDLELLRAVLSEPARPPENPFMTEERVGGATISIADCWFPSMVGPSANHRHLVARCGYLSLDWMADTRVPGAALLDLHASVTREPGTVLPLREWKQSLAAACVTVMNRGRSPDVTWAVGAGAGVLRVNFATRQAKEADVRAVCAMVRSVRIQQPWDVLPPAWPAGEPEFSKPGKSVVRVGPAVVEAAPGWKGDHRGLTAGSFTKPLPMRHPPRLGVVWYVRQTRRPVPDEAGLMRELRAMSHDDDRLVEKLAGPYLVPCVGAVVESESGERAAKWVMSDGSGVLLAILQPFDKYPEALDEALQMMRGVRFERVALA